MDTNTGIFEKINNLYNKRSFMDKYGFDVWTAVIISLVFFVITSYFYVMNNIKPILADWSNQKCNPVVIPFAGLINKGPNDTAFDFTGKNFTGCIQSILTNMIAYALQPIYYIVKQLTDLFTDLLDAVNSIRAIFDKIRTSIKDFSTETMGRTLNITMPIVQMIIGIKSMGAKMVGTLAASLYTLMGSYLTMQSFFLFTLKLITVVLYIIVGILVGLIATSLIPIVGSWAIPVVAADTAVMIMILVPTIMIQQFLSNVMSLSSRTLPKVPRCFAGATLLEVQGKGNVEGKGQAEGKQTPIAEVRVGDILKTGEVITATMKFSAYEQVLYNINGVYVTEEHRVLHPTLGWIHAKEHPARILIENFDEPFVYCLGTDTKTFTIGTQLFSDWDDIDEEVWTKIQPALGTGTGTGHMHMDNNAIHTHLDNGLVASTLVEMAAGNQVPIADVKINAILANGDTVLGTIKIDAQNLNGMYEYTYKQQKLSGFNVNICLDNSAATDIKRETIEQEEPYLYHLLTRLGSFKANGLTIRDYNYGIDKYIYP